MSVVFEIVTSNCYCENDPKANLGVEILSHILLSKFLILVQNAHIYIFISQKNFILCCIHRFRSKAFETKTYEFFLKYCDPFNA